MPSILMILTPNWWHFSATHQINWDIWKENKNDSLKKKKQARSTSYMNSLDALQSGLKCLQDKFENVRI